MSATRHTLRTRSASTAGYSLAELMISMGVMTVVMGVTMGGLADATKANDAVLNMTGMNNSLRIGMDLLVRDMLQVGSGLPPGHVIQIPSGTGSTVANIPGPPGTAFTTEVGDTDIPAVIPRPGRGPVINGVATDVVTTLAADNAFLDVPLTAMTATTVTVAAGPDIAAGPDRVSPGQLMMVSKGSVTTLLQVTAVDVNTRVLTFDNGDSLNLNQSGAAAGNLSALDAADPANTPTAARISRIRMITYYLDATTDPGHPALVRRINNGHHTAFDNTLGNAIAIDVDNLQFTYDLIDPSTTPPNPANVRMLPSDRDGTGRCAPNACTEPQIRKLNVAITGRSKNSASEHERVFYNTLSSQVSFRGMAFVDEYTAPVAP
jgi:hypothetical protein